MRTHSLRAVSFWIAAVATLTAPTCFASDTILIHGHIYTANPKAPWAQALALSGSRIDAVGTDAEISARKEAKTKVIDLEGRTVGGPLSFRVLAFSLLVDCLVDA